MVCTDMTSQAGEYQSHNPELFLVVSVNKDSIKRFYLPYILGSTKHVKDSQIGNQIFMYLNSVSSNKKCISHRGVLVP